MFRPPMLCGSPAFGWTDSGMAVSVFSVSSASSIARGPTEQLSPSVSTPFPSIPFTKLSSVAPLSIFPSSFIVTCAIMGISPLSSFTARIACASSATSENVSSTMRSTPPSMSPRACSLNASRASSYESFPRGSIWTPRGPMEPATRTSPPPAAFAIWAPFRLMSYTFCSSPCGASLKRFAPNVLVSITSAPAAT